MFSSFEQCALYVYILAHNCPPHKFFIFLFFILQSLSPFPEKNCHNETVICFTLLFSACGVELKTTKEQGRSLLLTQTLISRSSRTFSRVVSCIAAAGKDDIVGFDIDDLHLRFFILFFFVFHDPPLLFYTLLSLLL